MSAESQLDFEGAPDKQYVQSYIENCNASDGGSAAGCSDADVHQFKTWNGQKKRFQFNFTFDTSGKQAGKGGGGEISVSATESDLREMFAQNAEFDPSMTQVNLSKAAVIKTRIVGSTFPKRCKYTLELTDKYGRNMFQTHGYKNSDNAIFEKRGVPLYSNEHVLMQKDDDIDADLRRYGELSMSDITKNVTTIDYADPSTGTQRRIYSVPKYPNGVYFMYALEKANSVFPPGQSMASTDPNNPSFFQLPSETYEAVVAAYRKKLNNDVHFYDLTEIKAKLRPLTQGGCAASGFESITIEFEVYLAPMTDASQWSREPAFSTETGTFNETATYGDIINRYG